MLWYNPGNRKPRLQLKILQLSSTRHGLTKTEAELYFIKEARASNKKERPHYSEISHAFDALYRKKFVKRQSPNSRGKPYRLTIEGLKVLIHEANSEIECWNFVISFCVNLHMEENLTAYSVFGEILNAFRERFVPYNSIGSYSYILKIFNIMSRNLLNEVSQDKFVEDFLLILAKKREMTISEMESKMQKDRSTIKRTIQMLSVDTLNYSNHYSLTGGDDIDPENDRRRYIDFLQHCIIFYHDVDGQRYYHLSLFGILFLVTMLSINNKISTISTNESPFQRAADDIAILYRKKLPLIFGKWPLLKKYLKLQPIHNLESVLFNKEQEPYSANELSELGYETEYDNKLIKNIYPMYVSNNLEWDKLLYIGIKKLYENRNNNFSNFNMMKDDEANELVNVLDTWEVYLAFRRRLLNIEMSIDEIFEGIRMHEKKFQGNNGADELCHEGDYLLPLKLIEKAFEDEVTLVNYLKLMDSSVVPGGKNFQRETNRLKQIFTEDDEIKSLLMMFVKDSSNFHQNELGNIKTISESLELSIR